MKSNRFIAGFASLLLIVSCHNGGHRDGLHEEEGHNHEMEAEHTHEGEIHDHEHETEGHSDEIILTPEKAEAAGVVSEKIAPGEFYGVIPVGGKVTGAPSDQTKLVAGVSGTISFLGPVAEGAYVSEGDPIFIISGEHLQDGDQSERARIAYETAKRDYLRAAALVKDKIVSEKDFNAVKAEYENAKLAYDAIAGNSKDGVEIACRTNGYIKDLLVEEGDYVTVGQPVATIAENSRLYLKADLPERYFRLAPQITSAKFKTPYDDTVYDIKEMGGRLLAYGKNPADNSPYIPVTFEFNGNHEIISGTFAEIYLLTQKRDNVISLPVDAITEEQGVNFVYIQIDETCYRKNEVKLGESDGSRVEILSGLNGGEQVVTHGAIHVKLASAGNAIPAHTHQH